MVLFVSNVWVQMVIVVVCGCRAMMDMNIFGYVIAHVLQGVTASGRLPLDSSEFRAG